ncbi:MAG: glycoside hydrolase family 66 protein [Nocardioidaceae bacterium]
MHAARLVRRWLVSALVSTALVLGFTPTQPAGAAGTVEVTDVYTDDARYVPGQQVQVKVVLTNSSAQTWSGPVAVSATHLAVSAGSGSVSATVPAGGTVTVNVPWTAPPNDFHGYFVTASAGSGSGTTAIDISSDWTRFPRYGFMDSFPIGQSQAQAQADVDQLVRDYHLNALQFYDWMWRHENVIERDENGAPLPTWSDWAGNPISSTAVRQSIESAHARRVAAMPYAMSYAGLQGYEQISGVSPTWGIFNDTGHASQMNFDFGDGDPNTNLWLFNPTNANWQNYITDQYRAQVNDMGFDGVHLDQLGQRDTVYDFNGVPVDLATTFADLVNASKAALTANNPAKAKTVFNIVNGARDGWAASDVTGRADQDFVYSEIWEKAPTYGDLKSYVGWARARADHRAMVLAAYMNFEEIVGPRYEAESTTLNGVGVNNDHPGYTGSGFVDQFGDVGDYVEFTINAPEERDYGLVFRYTNATAGAVFRDVSVDGGPSRSVKFPVTSSWSSWSAEPYTAVHLTPGTHTVRVAVSSTGFLNLDSLTLGTFDEPSVRLANAAIAASGAGHIELGQGDELLGHPYFPNHSKQMTNSLRNAMRTHYDFVTAYENLLYDAKPTDSGRQFVNIAGQPTSGDASPGTIWTALSRTADHDVINLVNLKGNDATWRNVASVPTQITNAEVTYYLGPDATPTGVYLASPDRNGGATQQLPHTTGTDSNGTYVRFTVPSLEYWDLIYVKRGFNAPSGGRYEAEVATKTDVTVGSDHPGFTGSGFVDNFTATDSGVSFVVNVPVTGDYPLAVRFGNGGSSATRAIVVDGEFVTRRTYGGMGSWDTWATDATTVHLEAGIHTVLVWRQPSDTGAINVDSLTVG